MLNFLQLTLTPPESSVLYRGNYDPVLVSLSVVVAIFASYAALLVSQHVSSSARTATSRRLWIAVGGLCLGVGIWAMHFVGMLAFSLPCSTSYDTTLTLLSTIPGILASTLALKIISRRTLSHAQLATGGLLIGAGIGAMHYSGMAAMRLNGLIRYDTKLFALSILVAVILATLALWIKFRLQSWQARWNNGVTLASAAVMGLAVSGMHYTAMAAAYFIRDGDVALTASGISPTFLAAIVLAATCLIIVVTIVATYIGKPNVFSLGRHYRLIGLLIAGWGAIAWLSADYYYDRLAGNLYRQEVQLAAQQAEQAARNIDESIALLKGIALVFSRNEDTRRALRPFGVDATPSTLAYEERKQRWTQDKTLSKLNDALNVAATHLRGDVIWVMNAAGDCVASGNAGKPDSFVGSNYADRDYFRQAQAGKPGHQYAVGRTSNIPGLYYSHPVLENGHFLGTVVVKWNITQFSHWTDQANTFISDANGVIVLAADKRLEFRTLPNASVVDLSTEKRLMQYKRSTFEALEITPWESRRFPSAVRIGTTGTPFILASRTFPEGTITLHASRPLDELVRLDSERVWLFLLLAAAGSMLIVAASTGVLYLRGAQKTEEKLQLLNESLERRVQEEVAMNREKDHLLIQQSRLAAMGEMIHNIAHQWRQPINTLTILLANIKDAHEYNELDKPYLDDAVATGQKVIQNMSTTIDDFRNFFRPGRKKAPFPLQEALVSAVRMVEAALKNNHIALVTLPAETVTVYGQANEFAQVLVNILSNAKEAIAEKKVAAGKIEIAIGQENGLAWLSVSDNGGGIPEEILGKVFDPYFTTKGVQGSGIGLYMSKMIMDDMNGSITIRNLAGGTEIRLTLPLAE